MSYFTKNLKDNEELIRIVKRHYLSFVPAVFFTLITLLLPFFLMFLFFRWGAIGLIIFTFLLLVGFLSLLRLIITRYYNCLVITSQRVILYKQKGFFDRQVAEIEYPKIQDVSYHFKGIFQTLFHYGSLKIQILSSESIIRAEKIPHPAQIQDLIKQIRKNISLQTDNVSVEALVGIAKKLKDKLGSDKLKQILDE
ncbi:PH domain-containing protein [Patescibacteria group bacterium]|nr:PH domain-containing protein [Patescibacteria group bacterium]